MMMMPQNLPIAFPLLQFILFAPAEIFQIFRHTIAIQKTSMCDGGGGGGGDGCSRRREGDVFCCVIGRE